MYALHVRFKTRGFASLAFAKFAFSDKIVIEIIITRKLKYGNLFLYFSLNYCGLTNFSKNLLNYYLPPNVLRIFRK